MTRMAAELAVSLRASGARRIAFLGLAKNAGKTTALTAVLAELHQSGVVAGATSAGRDGEEFDAITGEPKPRFRVYPGQLVASAATTFESASFPVEELATLPFPTRFGPVQLRRAAAREKSRSSARPPLPRWRGPPRRWKPPAPSSCFSTAPWAAGPSPPVASATASSFRSGCPPERRCRPSLAAAPPPSS